MDRYWLLTWTTYGSWLPGDERGFVGELRDTSWAKLLHNAPGTTYDSDVPLLERFAREALKGPVVRLVEAQGRALLDQFHETATYRKWLLLAAAVMANHAHIVVGVEGDPEPSDILRDFKSYGSRALNKRWPRPESDTWWTESGSKRKLKGEANVLAGMRYVRDQQYPLVVWLADRYLDELLDAEASNQ